MRIKDPMGEGEEPYNLVPLTDMVFNLLIFFMCATTFAQIEKDVAVQLPHAPKLQALSAAPKQLIINIRQDGATIINGKDLEGADFTKLVTDYQKSEPTSTVVIRADKMAIMKYFAAVAATCRQAGFKEARIVYVDDDPAAH